MTNIVQPNPQINTFTSNSRSIDLIENNSEIIVSLPSTLANAIVNLNFLASGNPVTTGISGELTIKGRYENGRLQQVALIDLASKNSASIFGKFTELVISLTNLVGADQILVCIDQNINILEGGGASSVSPIDPLYVDINNDLAIKDASQTQKGAVKLQNNVSDTTSQDLAATPKYVTDALTTAVVKYDDITINLNSGSELQVKDAGITTAKIADNSITDLKISDNSTIVLNYDATTPSPTNYKKFVLAAYNGQLFYSTQDVNQGNIPNAASPYWNALVGNGTGNSRIIDFRDNPSILVDNAISANAISITVASTADFPEQGLLAIGTLASLELIYYFAKTATTFTNLIRGVQGTTAQAHIIGEPIFTNLASVNYQDNTLIINDTQTSPTLNREILLAPASVLAADPGISKKYEIIRIDSSGYNVRLYAAVGDTINNDTDFTVNSGDYVILIAVENSNNIIAKSL